MKWRNTALSLISLLLMSSGLLAQLTTYPDSQRLCGLVKSEVPGQWTVFAKGFLEVKPTILDATKEAPGVGRLCLLQGPPGTYGVVFFSDAATPPIITRIVLANVGPEPDPDDGDDDDEPDPEPSGKSDIVMFYSEPQLRYMTKEQNAVLNSLKLRDELKARGHTILEVFEDDVFTEGLAATYKPFAEAVKGVELPVLVLMDKVTKRVTHMPLPESPEAMLEILK